MMMGMMIMMMIAIMIMIIIIMMIMIDFVNYSQCFSYFLQAAFDYAVDMNLQVKPSCTYIQKYLKDINPQPEYLERVLPLD